MTCPPADSAVYNNTALCCCDVMTNSMLPHLANLGGHRVRELADEAGNEADAPGLLRARCERRSRARRPSQPGAPHAALQVTRKRALQPHPNSRMQSRKP